MTIPKLKKILGVCWYYRFDLEVKEFPNNPKYIVDGRKYFVEDKRKPLRDINVSVWKTTAKDKEWLFIKPTNSGYAYLVDTNVCKQERLKNNLVDALNYERERVKRSKNGLYNAKIVSYNNKGYIFDIYRSSHSISFALYALLSRTGPDNPTIRFTGGWVFYIDFKLITKPNQGKE